MSVTYGGELGAAMLGVEMLGGTTGIDIFGGLLNASMLDQAMLNGTQGVYPPSGVLWSLSGGELGAAMLGTEMLGGVPTV